jgi:sec-independent protein translocase protein TatA
LKAKTGSAPGRAWSRAVFKGEIERFDLPCGLVGAEEDPMGIGSFWHWILLAAVVLLLFGGRGKISELMGDFAQGIKSFKKGIQDDEVAKSDDAKTIDHQPPSGAAPDLKRHAEAERSTS